MTHDVEFTILSAAITPRPTASRLPAFDSERLTDLAEFHRLVPQVHSYLHSQGQPAPQRLQDAAAANARTSLRLFAHTFRIVESLRTREIDAVALKGPVLAYQLTGNLSLRMPVDVDVLIPRTEFVRAASIVAELGYMSETPATEAAIGRHLRRNHDLAYVHEDGTLLELHADIAQRHYSYHVDLRPWFREARAIQIGGHTLHTLAITHAAILAIIHGSKHVWSRLDMIADVAGFGGQDVDWEEVAAISHWVGIRRATVVAAALAKRFTGVELPIQLRDNRAIGIAERIGQRIERNGAPTYWQARCFDLAIRERTADRIRYMLRLGLKLPL